MPDQPLLAGRSRLCSRRFIWYLRRTRDYDSEEDRAVLRKVVHPHSNVAAICLREGSYAAISTSYLTHAVGSPRARVRATTRTISDCRRVPATTSTFGAGRVWASRHVRECAERRRRRRYELVPGASAASGRNSHLSDGSLVHPASSHTLVSNIKPCMSQCKPH